MSKKELTKRLLRNHKNRKMWARQQQKVMMLASKWVRENHPEKWLNFKAEAIIYEKSRHNPSQ